MTEFACTNCGRPYPQTFEYKCSACGGVFGVRGGLSFDPASIDRQQPGIWPYQDSFGLTDEVTPISLGEGNTPLVRMPIEGADVWIKNEGANPTGSFKDRLTTVEISALRAMGIRSAVEDSSGNAGASFAAYASAADIDGRVYVPDYASGPKRKQIDS